MWSDNSCSCVENKYLRRTFSCLTGSFIAKYISSVPDLKTISRRSCPVKKLRISEFMKPKWLQIYKKD